MRRHDRLDHNPGWTMPVAQDQVVGGENPGTCPGSSRCASRCRTNFVSSYRVPVFRALRDNFGGLRDPAYLAPLAGGAPVFGVLGWLTCT